MQVTLKKVAVATAATATLVALLSLLPMVSKAHALDDMGVVSGDTFELPGYNDGPSGGGVWPGSSGKGGDVGAMPLPNSVPPGGDIGGGPGSGPTGGDGPGTDGGPSVDLTRPPYLQPRDRNTDKAKLPFSAVSLDCAAGGDARTTSAINSVLPIQTVGGDEAPPEGTATRALEQIVFKDADALRERVKAMVDLVRNYGKAKSSGSSSDELQALAQQLGSATVSVAIALDQLNGDLNNLVRRVFSLRNIDLACTDNDSFRMARARLGIAVADVGIQALDAAKWLPELVSILGNTGHIGLILSQLNHAADAIGGTAVQFGNTYIRAFLSTWSEHFRGEIRRINSGRPR